MHVKNALKIIEDEQAADDQNKTLIRFELYRVPFFLEPGYMDKPDDWWEPHDTRMIRKFGSKERFLQVQRAHGLVPRGAEVGLDVLGFTQDNLTNRRQSSTLRSHRLVYYVAKEYSLQKSEELYEVLNRKHFIEGSLLNDMDMLKSALEEIGGVDVARCDAFLQSSEGVEAVLRTVDMVHSMGVHSIPTLVIDGGTFVLDGATRAGDIVTTLRKITRNSDGYSPRPRLFKESMSF
mmetsp:Transcript_18079/g.33932  ORF Transcript_18079/g.33932 Transcript_18079/m.33932 type:complete len:235 (+) Transcript_18079:153-857(+)